MVITTVRRRTDFLTTVSPRWKWASWMLLMYSCPRDWIRNSHLRNTEMLFICIICKTQKCRTQGKSMRSVLLPWEPLGVFLPGVVSRLPVPQPSVTVEAFDVVAVTWRDAEDECDKSLTTENVPVNKHHLYKSKHHHPHVLDSSHEVASTACVKLWSSTSLAARALSRLFCSQHHDSAGQLCRELSHKERSLWQWLGQCWIFHW